MIDKLDIVVSDLAQIGGVTSHVKRLLPYLKKRNIKFSILSHPDSNNKLKDIVLKSFWFLKFLLRKNNNLVHFHKSFGFLQFFYWYLFSRINTSNILITIHNNNILYCGGFRKRIIVKLLKATRYRYLFVVSDKVFDFLSNNSIKCDYLPAYVPPELKDIVIVESDKPLFLYSVYKATKENLVNTYGFDIALDLLIHYKESFNMLFLVGDKKKSDIDLINKMIKEKNVKDNVFIFFNKELISYVKNCVFILRPNRKDGFGISLQEAIDVNVLAVASNVCKRPEGTIVYSDFNDLIKIVKKIHILKDVEKKANIQRDELDYHIQLIDIYQTILM